MKRKASVTGYCLRKEAYDPRYAAKVAAWATEENRRRGNHRVVSMYLCEHCGAYHLTSHPRVEKQVGRGWSYKPGA